MSADREAYVTLATSDGYAIGALVLANSLKATGTTRDLVVMISAEGVSETLQNLLRETFTVVEEVHLMNSGDKANLNLLARPDLGVTFTKLHCWRLTQYQKAVFIDADCLVLQNIDDLFEREELSAAPDPGWPDCFNSGVFVFKPHEETCRSLMSFASQHGSFDGGDQGLLNQYFSDWSTKDIARHLPFVYNCISHTFYSYLPAFQQFRSKVRVIHFIGAVKPWHHQLNSATGQVQPHRDTTSNMEYLQRWWNNFLQHVQPKLNKGELPQPQTAIKETDHERQGIAATLAHVEAPLMNPACFQRGTGSDRDRQYAWERNEIDYTGADRFDNILNKIKSTMEQGDNKS